MKLHRIQDFHVLLGHRSVQLQINPIHSSLCRLRPTVKCNSFGIENHHVDMNHLIMLICDEREKIKTTEKKEQLLRGKNRFKSFVEKITEKTWLERKTLT